MFGLIAGQSSCPGMFGDVILMGPMESGVGRVVDTSRLFVNHDLAVKT